MSVSGEATRRIGIEREAPAIDGAVGIDVVDRLTRAVLVLERHRQQPTRLVRKAIE